MSVGNMAGCSISHSRVGSGYAIASISSAIVNKLPIELTIGLEQKTFMLRFTVDFGQMLHL